MKRVILSGLFLLAFLGFAAQGDAAVVTETVLYRHGEVELEGYLAYDNTTDQKRAAVLVVHEWKGLGEYAQHRARLLAEKGYVAFAVDMYGKGVRPQTHEEAAKEAGIYRNDRALMRARIQSALDVVRQHPLVDDARIAAIGYCFGGSAVLELARSGADVRGVASFHGALSTPSPADAKNIRGKVLVCHGEADTFVGPDEVAAFKKEMSDAGVDMRFESYPGAVHSFTVESAGSDPSTGVAYDAEADRRSWETLQAFLTEVFA